MMKQDTELNIILEVHKMDFLYNCNSKTKERSSVLLF